MWLRAVVTIIVVTVTAVLLPYVTQKAAKNCVNTHYAGGENFFGTVNFAPFYLWCSVPYLVSWIAGGVLVSLHRNEPDSGAATVATIAKPANSFKPSRGEINRLRLKTKKKPN